MKSRTRPPRKRSRRKDYPAQDIGNGLVQATPAAVLGALSRLPADLDWPSVRDLVVPVFTRRRPFPFETGTPVRVLLPPGVLTGFGVDIGPAVLHIGEDILATWPVNRDELADRALANLRSLVRRVRPRDVIDEHLDGQPVRILQSGEGWASTLVLLADELSRIFGRAPQRFIAPMRDLLISMPASVDPDLCAWLAEELAAMDPNALALESFVLADGRLTCAAIHGVEARA
jgi:hypothetical protein